MSNAEAMKQLNRMLKYGEKISEKDILSSEVQERKISKLEAYHNRFQSTFGKGGTGV